MRTHHELTNNIHNSSTVHLRICLGYSLSEYVLRGVLMTAEVVKSKEFLSCCKHGGSVVHLMDAEAWKRQLTSADIHPSTNSCKCIT